jgi:hypothetical protein
MAGRDVPMSVRRLIVEVSGADAVEGTGAPIIVASILSEQSIRADIARRRFPNPVVTLLPSEL